MPIAKTIKLIPKLKQITNINPNNLKIRTLFTTNNIVKDKIIERVTGKIAGEGKASEIIGMSEIGSWGQKSEFGEEIELVYIKIQRNPNRVQRKPDKILPNTKVKRWHKTIKKLTTFRM